MQPDTPPISTAFLDELERQTRATVAAADPPESPFSGAPQEDRDRLTAFVEANTRMPEEARQRILQQLSEGTVPVQVVERIESRMGG